jgi:hypothetical protein
VSQLSDAQELKFELFARGLAIAPSAAAVLQEVNEGRALTPADYASTSGVILRLEDDVWVNAPIETYNPNFVHSTPLVLEHTGDGFVVRGSGRETKAAFWRPPGYHGGIGPDGAPLNNYVFTHGDRVRLAPVRGCHFVCTFCNIPYEDRYGTKAVNSMLHAVRAAVDDAVQPAHHLLISGGTPSRRDVPYLRGVYEQVLHAFPKLATDIMMVPMPGLYDLSRLDALGLAEISVNLEVYSDEVAARVMRQKHRQGRDYYLQFLADAAEVLGGRRVRSMLMVGLEPVEGTLAGVRAIAERGCVPVLSPFRPDPATPLRDLPPPDADTLRTVWTEASAIAADYGLSLGPDCPPCTHNTMTFVPRGDKSTTLYPHPLPRMVSGAR